MKLFKWIEENLLKANGGKCHLLVTIDKPMSFNNAGNIITSNQEKNF